ncbi:MAG: hypothetical protein QOF26_2369 [Baekduia sp.]|jgi:hypothetical protein|nr:hypothetical protein [Baekduia sp.]
MLAKIEWNKIGELLYVAPIAALAVAIAFSLIIVGVARADDARREGNGATATMYSALAFASLAAFAAVVIYGVTIIVQK